MQHHQAGELAELGLRRECAHLLKVIELDGDLYVRDPYQIRGQWVPLSKLQTTLKPKFKGTVVGAPSVSASVLRNDDGSWSASLQLSAPVMRAACDPHQMCSGGPDTDTEYQDLGEAVLHAAP